MSAKIQVDVIDVYSPRRAVRGSIREARRAGRRAAKTPTMTRTAADADNGARATAPAP
jgi:hypothetical protein